MFDAKFTSEVLLPLSDAAYFIPLKVGVLPVAYEFQGPIKIDGSQIEWHINRIKPNRRDCIRAALLNKRFGWVCYSKADETVIVAFKGTDCIYDILRDFEFDSEPYQCAPSYGMVHAGFQHIYLAIRDSVISLIKGFPQAKRCIITGHSLGGALSQLSAPDLYYQHLLKEAPEVVTFASPRAGHQDFVDKFNHDIPICYRVVNKWDMIPMTPPMCNGYNHVGEEIEIDGGKTLIASLAHSLEKSYISGLNAFINEIAGK